MKEGEGRAPRHAAWTAALAEGRGAEILAELLARHRRLPEAPAPAILGAEAAFQAGRHELALELLAAALRLKPGLPRLHGLARRLIRALSEAGRLAEAHRALRLLDPAPAPLVIRHVRDLLEADILVEEAAAAAAMVTDPRDRLRLLDLAIGVLPRRAAARHLLLALARDAPAWTGEGLRKLCGGLAQAGEAGEARALLARGRFADAEDRALCEAFLLRGEGRLEEARARLAPFLAADQPRPELLMAAHDWAWEALALEEATGLALRLLRCGAAAGAPSPMLIVWLAKLLAEQGLHAEAWEAVAALREALRAEIARAPAPPQPETNLAFRAALSLADVPSARLLAARLGPNSSPSHALSTLAALPEREPVAARFVERAAAAWRDPPRALTAALDSDLAIIAPMGMLSWLLLREAAEDGPVALPEQQACHLVLATALAQAEAAGLDVVVLPSPGYAVPPPLLARGVPFVSYHSFAPPGAGVHVKGGPLPDTVLIDSAGYSGWSAACGRELGELPLAEVPAETARAWLAGERRRLSDSNLSKWQQRARGGGGLPRGPAVLVALQVPDDNALRHRWVDMYALARAVVARFRGSGTTVVIKRHPKCRDPRTDALLRELGREAHVLVSDASIHDLLPAVQAVYCVNSGLGAEALLYGVAVHIAGLVDYRHACHEAHHLDALLTGEAACNPRLDAETLARYLYWYRNHHHVPLDRPGALEAAIRDRIILPARRRRQGA
ncbi:MAG: hypothetical protein N3D18_13555 [Roseococcus sp.]|nr:hypothetical protein [Roseococcus sp.]